MIIDLHTTFLTQAAGMLQHVRDADVKWMQSFIISMIIRDLYARNQARYTTPEEAMVYTKEELRKLFEKVNLVTGDIEAFLAKSADGII